MISVPSRFDQTIKRYRQRYLPVPGPDWRWLKAQFYCESRLDPMAESPVGAKGVAQFMPETWADMERQIWDGERRDINDPEASIQAGIYYMRYLRSQWSAPRPAIEAWLLAVASYNAGLGNLLEAQKAAGGANDFATIIAHLHEVTGEHAEETRAYCRRICETYFTLVLGY